MTTPTAAATQQHLPRVQSLRRSPTLMSLDSATASAAVPLTSASHDHLAQAHAGTMPPPTLMLPTRSAAHDADDTTVPGTPSLRPPDVSRAEIWRGRIVKIAALGALGATIALFCSPAGAPALAAFLGLMTVATLPDWAARGGSRSEQVAQFARALTMLAGFAAVIALAAAGGMTPVGWVLGGIVGAAVLARLAALSYGHRDKGFASALTAGLSDMLELTPKSRQRLLAMMAPPKSVASPT